MALSFLGKDSLQSLFRLTHSCTCTIHERIVFSVEWETFRIPGVLQRFAITYLVVALTHFALGNQSLDERVSDVIPPPLTHLYTPKSCYCFVVTCLSSWQNLCEKSVVSMGG